MADCWTIVLSADGTVLSVGGGAPQEWSGVRMPGRPDTPSGLRAKLDETLRRLHGSTDLAVESSFHLDPPGVDVQLLAVEALPLRRSATDLRVLLASAIELMEMQASAQQVALKVHVDAGIPATLHVDRQKLAWAVTTLIGNALRFVNRGTRLMPGGTIAVSASYDSDTAEVYVVVQDDGTGIAVEKLVCLLRGLPGDDDAEALGLSVVQDVIEAHGGRIEIESRTGDPDSGTTVRLIIPAL